MKNILALIIITLVGCSSNQKELANSSEKDSTLKKEAQRIQKEVPVKVTAQSDKKLVEVLDKDSIWLNDDIKFVTTQTELKNKLGSPDSVTYPNFECGAYISGVEPWGDSISVWYFKGAEFVAFKDVAELRSVEFSEWEWTLHNPSLVLSRQTTLNDLKAVFPYSVSKSYEWVDARDNRSFILVRIAPKSGWDDQWVLKFYDKYLVEIEYWSPC